MPNYIFRQFSSNLWQSDVIGAQLTVCTEEYKKLGIKAVLCPAANVDISYNQDLPVLKLPLWDDKLIPQQYLTLAATFYAITGKKLLVHCLGGINRSMAFIAFFLALEGMDFEKAWRTVQKQTTKGCPYPELKASMVEWFKIQNEMISKINPEVKGGVGVN